MALAGILLWTSESGDDISILRNTKVAENQNEVISHGSLKARTVIQIQMGQRYVNLLHN